MSEHIAHYLLFYDLVSDYSERRREFRQAHLEAAWASHVRGELVLGGALANPLDGAVLLFRGSSPTVAEDFAMSDPYVRNGLVTRWRVREWTTVAGASAATPVYPQTQSEQRDVAERVSIADASGESS